MASPTLFRLDEVERARIREFGGRMGAVRLQALALLVVVAALGAQGFGPLVVVPVAALVAAFALLAPVARRARRIERPVLGMLVLSQVAVVAMIALAERFQLDLLGLLVLPATAGCLLLPRRLMALVLPWSVVVMAGAAYAIDAARLEAEPPILLLPLGVMLSVALPAAMIRRLEIDSRDTALVDALTGALNRGALDARIGELSAQAHTMPVRVGVIMADLDRFKAVNDDLGHDAGDLVLKECVRRMRAVLGPLTPVYRVGGEEFAVLVAGADEVGVQIVAERLGEAIRSTPMVGRTVTVSLGIAAATLDAHPVARILAVADEALYRAKRAGRDRVASANLMPMSVVPGQVAGPMGGADGVVGRGPDADLEPVPGSGAADAPARPGDPARASGPARGLMGAPPVALEHDQGNWLVRGDFERDHLRETAHALSRTHHGALGFVFVALVASIPWLGWELMAPAVPAVIAYHAAERRVLGLRRPEFMLGGAWLLVQLSIFAGALIASPAEPYMLVLFAPLMIGMTAVFPTRGVQLLSATTLLLCVLAAVFARPDLLVTHPGLAGSSMLIVIGIALMSSVTGRSAIEFRTRAVVDPLTGLLTRAALRTRLAEIDQEGGATVASVSVIAFDIDRFKTLNDDHGHACGDEALHAVGVLTRAQLQPLEWGFRLGGDEFVVVLPAGGAHATRVAERLRVGVAAIEVAGVALTGSFGVASTRPGEPFDFETVCRRADAALYEAKRAGRNRVAVAPPLGPGPSPIATVLREIA